MNIPEEQIDQVRNAANIVEVVSAHVPLKRKGQNHLGLCPFHSEKTPSFTVHEQKQIFHCFGCGEGGNVFSFLMKMEGLEFPLAVRQLADRYGIAITQIDGKQLQQGRDERDRVRRINELAMGFFREQLGGASGARDYLARRGFSAAAAERFELGWAPQAWDGLTRHLGRSGVRREDLLLAGVAVPRNGGNGHYDRFRARVMFPIRGVDGDLVGFGGRALGEDTPKYMNSPETPLYHKSNVLYGLYQARSQKARLPRVAVVEGYLDVIACHMGGISWAVAPLGTALTESHVRLLSRYTDQIDLVFDGDKAGRQAARKAVALLAPHAMEVRVVTLPAGEDPDSLLAKEGGEAMVARLAAGEPMMEFLFRDCLDGVLSAPIERRISAAQPVMEVLAKIPDALRKGHYLGRLAEALDVDEGALRREFAKGRGKQPRQQRPETAQAAQAAVANAAPLPQGEGLLLHLVMQGCVDSRWLSDRVSASAFTDPRARRVATALSEAGAAGEAVERVVARLQGVSECLSLVTGWLSQDVTVEGDPVVCAEACVAALMRRESKEVDRQLLKDIRAAEAQGDSTRLMALLRQKNALTQSKRQVMVG